MSTPEPLRKLDGRKRQRQTIEMALELLRLFGHMRRSELATAMWPYAPKSSGYVLACRLVNRLLKHKYVLEKTNSLGSKSLALAQAGADYLLLRELSASAGYELAIAGPQFFHRTLGTCYLLDKRKEQKAVFGEHAILKGYAPWPREYFKRQFTKVPDGLVLYDGAEHGYKDGTMVMDWVEVESAYKPYEELRKALQVLTTSLGDTPGHISLQRVVFVYDNQQKHEKAVTRAVDRFLREMRQQGRDIDEHYLKANVVLASCTVEPPFVWDGMTETSVWDLQHAAAPSKK